MERKTVTGYAVAAALFAVIGAALIFGLRGYDFLGYGFWGLAVVSLVLCALSLLHGKHEKAEKKLKKVVFLCVFAFLIILAVTEIIIVSDAKTTAEGETYAVVLGAGVNGETPSAILSWRVRAAAEYLKEHPETVCIASGGQGPGEDVTEASCIRNELIKAGIGQERILLEERAGNTRENLEYSKEIMDGLSGGKPYTAAIVTSDFHLCRAKTFAYRLGLDTAGVSAKTKLPVLAVSNYFREAFAVWYLMIKS
ncbi:MAG: YdcF family protein [Oscillospiraceae bacterium]|nr:YdcF family protein [Oscillospiraceae bacterium]